MPDPISWSLAAPYLLLALAIGYLLGSIPFGLVFTRLAGMGDVRAIGSGNIGATNVLRTGNKKVAAATLIGDMLKGTLAILLGWQFGPDQAVLAGLGAFLGHCFPIWLKFKGGKGVATYVGIILGFSWKVLLVFAAVWLTTAAITRYSSLSALLATIATPLAFYFFGHVQWAELFALLTLITFWRHRENITRLVKGTEGKIGKKG